MLVRNNRKKFGKYLPWILVPTFSILVIFILITIVFSNRVYTFTVFRDEFTDRNHTSLDQHSPDFDILGSGWTQQVGTQSIYANKAKSDGTGGSYATADSGIANAIISTRITIDNLSSGQGLIARYTDANNHFRIVWFGGGPLLLIKREKGLNTILDQARITPADGQVYEFVLRLDEASISLSINGTRRLSAISTFNRSATIHGIFAGNSVNVKFDNYQVDRFSLNPINITRPSSYQVYQRNKIGVSDIDIAGTYIGSPTAIEARFKGGRWKIIDSSPTGGIFSGSLQNQSGQGTLEVRFENKINKTDSVDFVGIGDVFLVAFAQSNAVGNLNKMQRYSHPALKAGMCREDHLWAELADQTDSDKYDDGSIWPLLATKIMENQNIPVAFITTADGGTGIVDPGEWQQENTSYTNAIETYNACGVNGITAILSWFGEADLIKGNSPIEFRNFLPPALDAMQVDLGTNAPVIMTMVGHVELDHERWVVTESELNNIRQSQIYLWETEADIYPGAVGHDIDLSKGDGIHYNSNADGLTMANRWWRAIDAALYSGTESARGPQFSYAIFSGTDLLITFTGGEGDLINQTDPKGWSVTDANGIRTVLKSNGTNNNVLLTVDKILSEPVTVSFASGNNNAGGTLRDSGTYPMPPEPFINQYVSAEEFGRQFRY